MPLHLVDPCRFLLTAVAYKIKSVSLWSTARPTPTPYSHPAAKSVDFGEGGHPDLVFTRVLFNDAYHSRERLLTMPWLGREDESGGA